MRKIVVVALTLVVTCAAGDVSAQGVDALQKCRAIVDSAQRAQCYDAVLDGAPTAPASPSIETDGRSSRAQLPNVVGVSDNPPPLGPSFPQQKARSAARKEAKRLEKLTKVETKSETDTREFSSGLRSIQELPSGKIFVQLSNGEIWVQTSEVRPSFNEAQSKGVVIRRNILGTYLMQVDNAPYAFSVRQIR